MYFSSSEAARELGVSVQTIYAYVSRGLIRAEDTGARVKRYHAEDIAQLKARRELRQNPAHMVEQALYWGSPVLESALTLIDHNHLYYRGQSVIKLATMASFEQVAALLWTGDIAAATTLFPAVVPQIPLVVAPDLTLIDKCCIALPLAAALDYAAYDLRPIALYGTGARVLQCLVQVASQSTHMADLITGLWHAFGDGTAESKVLLNATLIVCADHELNVSSFTARCVASAGATLYNVVSAGLAALQGIKHGKMAEQSERLLDELESGNSVRSVLVQRVRRGEPLPGFGHPLYPNGDPRGRLLLDLLQKYYGNHVINAIIAEAEGTVAELFGEAPTLDLGLAAVARVLNLPAGMSLVLFALGRTVGWIGHAIEQYATDQLIRPRARYVGFIPDAHALD